LPEGKSTESGLLKGRAANYFEVIIEPDENFSKQSMEGWQEVEITGINDHFLIARRQP
jgi:inorganic pyrophosphatase/exopolyphosphatase